MDSDRHDLIAETKKYIKDPVMQVTAIPVYLAFAMLGLIFHSHLAIAVFVFLCLGVVIDNMLIGQAMHSVRCRLGYVNRRWLLRAMLWRRAGLVLAVVGSIVASGL